MCFENIIENFFFLLQGLLVLIFLLMVGHIGLEACSLDQQFIMPSFLNFFLQLNADF